MFMKKASWEEEALEKREYFCERLRLEVDGMSTRIERRFMNRFCKSRVSMNGAMEVVFTEFCLKSNTHFCDELSGIFTDDVRSEEFTMLFTKEKFYETFSVC